MPAVKPNILLITSDQQHWDTLGVTNQRIHTPALDQLCAEGTRFERAYCPNPVCTPSRASIITGMYPSQHGAWTIGVKLDEHVPTVGDALQQQGYATGLIGKAHFQPLASTPEHRSLECQPILRDLDFWQGFHGPWYGFQHIEIARNHADESHVGQHYALWLEAQGLHTWRDYFQRWPPDSAAPQREGRWDLPAELHYTTWTAERTIAFIERHAAQQQPFFAWASFHDPHPPYLVPEPWASMYDPEAMQPGTLDPDELELMPPHMRLTQEPAPDFERWRETPYANHGFHSHLTEPALGRRHMALYYGMISFMDQQIGRVLATLDRLGLAESTLVIFSTDHGHFLGQHGLWFKGAFHYEDLLRLPFIVRWPSYVPAGHTSQALQSLVDLAPTFLDVAGAPRSSAMQGVSQLDVWRGAASHARDHVVVENRHQPTTVHLRTYIDARYKLTVYRNEPYGELFDLVEDPSERRNLWNNNEYAALKADLLHRFVQAEMQREPIRLPRIASA